MSRRTQPYSEAIPRPELSLKDRVCAGFIEYGILAILVFSPLPAASVYEWSVLVIELAALLMAGAYVLMKEKPPVNQALLRSSRWAPVFFGGFFLFLLVQVVPFPVFILKFLSPSAHQYKTVYGGSGGLKFASFSIIPSDSFQKGLELFAYFLIGWLVFRTVHRRRQIFRLVTVLVGMGIFQALYGLFELSSKSPRLLFYRKVHNLDSVTGTFVNRNHLSGYLEMIIPLAIGLIIARMDLFSLNRMSWRKKILRFSEKGLSVNLLLGLGIVLMSIAIVYSKSRSGVFILVLVFVLLFGMGTLFFEKSGLQTKGTRGFLQVLFVVILILSFGLGIDATLKRFALDNFLHERRPLYWAYALQMFSGHPLMGTGLGTFGALAPRLEGRSGPISIGHAHNDYLEYLSELGVLGSVLLFGGILSMIVISWRAWRSRRHPEVKGLALGGLVALSAILVHSLTDFNLHIPANMVLFSVILPLTAVTAFYRKTTAAGKR
jgi:O-antigen ligase